MNLMTPRQVRMGNKMYKLNIKYGSSKRTMEVAPDMSLIELKSKIRSEFKIKPDEILLLYSNYIFLISCEDNKTLKQAKICNGSKILVSLAPSAKPSKLAPGADKLIADIEDESSRLEASLVEMDLELSNQRFEDVKKSMTTVGNLGEKLMKLLEKLDQVHLPEDEKDLRKRRKCEATKLNRYLDRIDELKGRLKKSLSDHGN